MGMHRLTQRPRTASSGSQAPGAQPNILLITTDQQHHRLAGYAGDRYVRTPALDRLAREGTRFELTYAANPVCVPSRYSLLTGHLPHRFGGLETNQQSNGKPLPAITDWVSTPPMGHCLHAAGYDTVSGGKLHVEGMPTFTPEAEQRFGFHCLTGDSREELALRSRDFLLARGREPARARRPFFLWASFINPHDICRVLPRDADRPSFAPTTLEECPPLPENFAPTRADPRWISRFRDGTLGDESTAELGLNRRFGRSARSWSGATVAPLPPLQYGPGLQLSMIVYCSSVGRFAKVLAHGQRAYLIDRQRRVARQPPMLWSHLSRAVQKPPRRIGHHGAECLRAEARR